MHHWCHLRRCHSILGWSYYAFLPLPRAGWLSPHSLSGLVWGGGRVSVGAWEREEWPLFLGRADLESALWLSALWLFPQYFCLCPSCTDGLNAPSLSRKFTALSWCSKMSFQKVQWLLLVLNQNALTLFVLNAGESLLSLAVLPYTPVLSFHLLT